MNYDECLTRALHHILNYFNKAEGWLTQEFINGNKVVAEDQILSYTCYWID